jgi:hypothetical protein
MRQKKVWIFANAAFGILEPKRKNMDNKDAMQKE